MTDTINALLNLEPLPHSCPECEYQAKTVQILGLHRRHSHGVVGVSRLRADERDKKNLVQAKAKSEQQDQSGLHKRAVKLYEVMEGFQDDDHRVLAKLNVMLAGKDKMFRGMDGSPSLYRMRQSLQHLVAIGSVRMNGNRVKILVQHPDGIERQNSDEDSIPSFGLESRSRPPMPLPSVRTPAPKLAEQVKDVDPVLLAESVARKMWERYEWALSEIGKAHAMLEVRDAEIKRLRVLLEDKGEIGIVEAARLILHNEKK